MIVEGILFFVVVLVFLYALGNLLFGRSGTAMTEEWEEQDDKQSAGTRIQRQLRVLKLDIEPLVFVVGVALFAALVFLLFLEIFPGALFLATMAGAGFMVFAVSLLRDLSAWRARKFETQLVDAMDLMQAALLAGENAQYALVVTAEATTGAIQKEFHEITKRLDLGLSIEQSTARMVELYDSEGTRLFTQVLIAKWRAGVELSGLMGSVNRIIRNRVKLRMRVSGQLSGARYAAILVALLPYVLIPFFLWKQPGWLDILGNHPNGPTFLFAAIGLQLLGFFWLRQILRTDP